MQTIKRSFKVALIVIVSLLLVRISLAHGSPKVVFMVDVESKGNLTLPAQIDATCDDGSACGLMEIVRMLNERGMTGIFFLNVYEYTSWGEEVLRDITVRLRTAGQEVALHTHPGTVYDPSRREMYEYTTDEQAAIIRDGVRLLTLWTGQPAVAHRAGNYSADEGTLNALERNHVYIDSSLFWGHPHCRLTRLNLPRNLPAVRGKLIEVPVTVYQREEYPRYFRNSLAPVMSIRKIDPNWFVDAREATAALDALTHDGIPLLVVFLHSFSLMTEGRKEGSPRLDRHSRDIFRAILTNLAEKRLPVMSMQDLANSKTVRELGLGADVIPQVRISVGLHRYLWHRFRTVATKGTAASLAFLPFLVSGVSFAVWRRRYKGTSDKARKTPTS